MKEVNDGIAAVAIFRVTGREINRNVAVGRVALKIAFERLPCSVMRSTVPASAEGEDWAEEGICARSRGEAALEMTTTPIQTRVFIGADSSREGRTSQFDSKSVGREVAVV